MSTFFYWFICLSPTSPRYLRDADIDCVDTAETSNNLDKIALFPISHQTNTTDSSFVTHNPLSKSLDTNTFFIWIGGKKFSLQSTLHPKNSLLSSVLIEGRTRYPSNFSYSLHSLKTGIPLDSTSSNTGNEEYVK